MSKPFSSFGLAAIPYPRGLNEGRLTLESGVSVSTSDQTAKTTVYLTPHHGSRLALFDGSKFVPRPFSEVSVAVPSTLFRPFDVWARWTGSAVAIDTDNWNQSTGSITAVTAAKPPVVTSTSHGLANDDLVGIAGITGTLGTNAGQGLNGKVWRAANVATNTFECEGGDTQELAYTSGGTWYKIPNTRATAITLQNGVYVKSGDTSRRYLGTAMTHGTSGQTEDSDARRLIWNHDNRITRRLRKTEATDNWTYSTQAYRAVNNDTRNRVEAVVGVREVVIDLTVSGISSSAVVGRYSSVAAGKNRCTVNDFGLIANVGGLADIVNGMTASMKDIASLGYAFYQWNEYAYLGTLSFYSLYSEGADKLRESGIEGTVWG